VESGSGGTMFAIYLPALPGQEVAESPVSTGKMAAASLAKVLIMDDEPMVRDIAGEMLLHLGFTVETANHGQEAVTLYKAAMENGSPVDIVIMDLTIPGGMGGAEAIRQLRKIDPAVKAIVSSGYSNDPVMSDYSSYGFSGMVNKPFQLRELHEAVLKVLG
jgi:two-component system, cell cycle sensor histidine kinase and response regulator CckA